MRVRGNELPSHTLRHSVVDRSVFSILVLIEHVGVSVRERSSLNILTWDTNVEAILNQRRKGKCFSSSPINIFSRSNARSSSLKNLLDKSMEGASSWENSNFLSKISDSLNRNAWELFFLNVKLFDGLPFLGHPILSFVFQGLTFGVSLFKILVDERLHLSKFVLVNYSAGKKLLFVLAGNWGHLGDLLVHEWLGETWLIELIVTHLSVTDEINDNVMLELLSVLSCGSENKVDVIKAVSIHMKDWSIDSFGQVRAVDTWSCLVWSCGETNLVVHNNMNSSSNSVILQVLHLYWLINNTLTRESSISMNQNRDNFLSLHKV